MRIKRLKLTNFRGFESLDVDLDRPVTVLVGVNGSGKTSVLRAIAAAAEGLVNLPRRRSKKRLERSTVLAPQDLRVDALDGAVSSEFDHEGDPFVIVLGYDPEDISEWGIMIHNGVELVEGLDLDPRPFAFLVGTERRVSVETTSSGSLLFRGHDAIEVVDRSPGYARFVEWFKEREDVENARRVAARDFNVQDPQLRAVRDAVAAVMPGFDNLRIERDQSPPSMVATKNGVELRLDQLSDGERNLIALAGDLARRMVIADPNAENPLQTEGIILIDEVEQHLHPAWQRRVIPALQRAFPKAQLIVTTHSPQVISSVPASAVVLLDGTSAHAMSNPTEGRDTNAILREVFGVTDRPEATRDEVNAIAELIDHERLSEARERLAKLAEKLSERDDEVLRLRTKLDFAEVGL